MGISDWSSHVCSSDLIIVVIRSAAARLFVFAAADTAIIIAACRAPTVIAASAAEVTTPCGSGTAFAAIKHHKFGVETLQHDFGRIAVLTTLILPFPCAQLAFYIDLAALAQEALSDIYQAFRELGRASCRDRVCQNVSISVVAV